MPPVIRAKAGVGKSPPCMVSLLGFGLGQGGSYRRADQPVQRTTLEAEFVEQGIDQRRLAAVAQRCVHRLVGDAGAARSADRPAATREAVHVEDLDALDRLDRLDALGDDLR